MPTNNDDNWKKAVDMLTGYVLPDQASVMNSLMGNDGIPLMHVRLEKISGSTVYPGFVSMGGFRQSETDFVFPYYRDGEDGTRNPASDPKGVSQYTANITFIGRSGPVDAPPTGDDEIIGGSVTNPVLVGKGIWNKEGDSIITDATALGQYVQGSGAALEQLKDNYLSTHGFTSHGKAVPDDSYVDLVSFTEVAKSLDRAVKFYIDAAKTLDEWDNKDIGEDSNSWDGTAAAMFKELVHKLARNYDGYANEETGLTYGEGYIPVGSVGPGDLLGYAPARAINEVAYVIRREAQNLYNAWQMWKPLSNPHRWLYDMIQDAWMNQLVLQMNNVTFESRSAGHGYTTIVEALPGFVNEIEIYGERYGPPNESSTWKKIGEEAVLKWQNSIKDVLGPVAEDAIIAIREVMTNSNDVFAAIKFEDKDTGSLANIASEAEADAEKAAAKDEQAKAKAEADAEKAAAKAEADAEKAAAKAEQAKAKAEADAEKAAAKAEADAEKAAAKEEQAAAKAEADAEKAAAKAEADAEKAAAKAEQAA
ncbi:AAWKG family protein, partial [Streptomyces sp. NPDC002870]|uniref:AAWKG family protein n=1 Tax=Streptomyces sp. NPDC002870 TaxID=3364666 RepID=UPI0036893642